MMLKKIIVPSLLLSIVLTLPACWWKKKEVPESAAQNLYVLNVLDPEQYRECHIPGSVNVPYDKVAEYAAALDRNAEVVCYCSNYQCTASAQVAKQLKDLGFEHVSTYEGGIAEWYQNGLPVDGAVAQGAPASEYLTKTVEAPAELVSEVPVISAQALKDKLVASGLLKTEQVPASAPVA